MINISHYIKNKKMKYKLILSNILLLISLMSCDFFDRRLIIKNQSQKNIRVDYSLDTLLSLEGNQTFILTENDVQIGKKKNFLNNGKNGWEIQANESVDKKLHIFIMSEDTLYKYDAKTIVKLQKYEKRIDISIAELKAKNWEVVYK
jgi:hypothetical protein